MSLGLGQGIPLARAERLNELRNRFGGELDEPHTTRSVRRIVAPPQATEETDLSPLFAARSLKDAAVAAGVVLCAPSLAAKIPHGSRWLHPHPEWVLAQLLELAAARGQTEPERAASAVVEAGAELGPGVRLGPGAVVMSGARVGAGSSIGPNAVIFGNVWLGERVSVGASAVIGRPGFGWVTGPGGERRRMPQPGGVIVEDDVEIGALSSIDSGTLMPTRVGAGTKLDAQVHVGHNVSLGPGCIVAAQSGFAGSAILGAGVLVGGQVGVKDHVVVGDGARLAAKSGVISDVAPGATVAGFPAVPRLRWLRAMAKLLARPPHA